MPQDANSPLIEIDANRLLALLDLINTLQKALDEIRAVTFLHKDKSADCALSPYYMGQVYTLTKVALQDSWGFGDMHPWISDLYEQATQVTHAGIQGTLRPEADSGAIPGSYVEAPKSQTLHRKTDLDAMDTRIGIPEGFLIADPEGLDPLEVANSGYTEYRDLLGRAVRYRPDEYSPESDKSKDTRTPEVEIAESVEELHYLIRSDSGEIRVNASALRLATPEQFKQFQAEFQRHLDKVRGLAVRETVQGGEENRTSESGEVEE